jgi:hypothetical protein
VPYNPSTAVAVRTKEDEMAASFGKVEEYLENAKGIAFDTCHKIYVLMDDEQMEEMRGYGYDPLISAEDTTPNEMLTTIMDWYEDSCGLRFVQAVHTNHEDPNAGFVSLIEQGAEWEEESDSCSHCFNPKFSCSCEEAE